MIILAIESSCDETAAAVLKDGELLSNVVVSQVDIFKAYGGVIPEVAARSHLEAILPVIDKALEDAKVTWDDVTHIAVTHTPGLLGSLLIGTLTARTLAILHNKPLYAVHHLKSHIYSNWLRRTLERTSESSFEAAKDNSRIFRGDYERAQSMAGVSRSRPLGRGEEQSDDSALRSARLIDEKNPTEFSQARKNLSDVPSFPLLALVISGGHTQIVYMKEHNSFEIIGTTLDDAVGECFDKVAKILGLPYPGGPSIAHAAEKGDENKYRFPHPNVEGLNFSFSGLKTAVLRAVQKEVGVGINYPSHDLKKLLNPEQIADFAASFQKTAIAILLEKLQLALEQHPDVKSVVFAGGVSANKALRKEASRRGENVFPSGSSSPARTTTYIPDGADRFAQRAVLPDAQCMTSSAESGDPDKNVRPQALEASPQLYFPAPEFSGDNAAMVAMAAFYEIKSGVKPTDPYNLTLAPRSVLC